MKVILWGNWKERKVTKKVGSNRCDIGILCKRENNREGYILSQGIKKWNMRQYLRWDWKGQHSTSEQYISLGQEEKDFLQWGIT